MRTLGEVCAENPGTQQSCHRGEPAVTPSMDVDVDVDMECSYPQTTVIFGLEKFWQRTCLEFNNIC